MLKYRHTAVQARGHFGVEVARPAYIGEIIPDAGQDRVRILFMSDDDGWQYRS